jgi:hypothetical protein
LDTTGIILIPPASKMLDIKWQGLKQNDSVNGGTGLRRFELPLTHKVSPLMFL